MPGAPPPDGDWPWKSTMRLPLTKNVAELPLVTSSISLLAPGAVLTAGDGRGATTDCQTPLTSRSTAAVPSSEIVAVKKFCASVPQNQIPTSPTVAELAGFGSGDGLTAS